MNPEVGERFEEEHYTNDQRTDMKAFRKVYNKFLGKSIEEWSSLTRYI